MARLQTLFDGDIPRPEKKASTSGYPAFQGGNLSRLNADWIGSLLSADLEVRSSLKRMRARCRQLANNNDYVARFVSLVKQNVVGPKGILLEVQLPEATAELQDEIEDAVEKSWSRWCKKGNCTADGRMSFREALNVALETLVIDGECFIRKVSGFDGNPHRYALQFLDADLFDTNFSLPARAGQNKISMSVELDAWERPVAYWAFQGHPSEGGGRRYAIPAEEIIHLYVFRRAGQTRGVPFLHSAMTRLNMLGGYEEAELVAARIGACKMGFFKSQSGDEYQGTNKGTGGPVSVSVEPGNFEQLPMGMEVQAFNVDHPNAGFPDFVKAMLRGVSMGVNASYASISGDLRDVNFSSLRQGVLDERDGWRCLQTYATEGLCEPVYAGWLPMAFLANQLKGVPLPPPDEPMLYIEAATWRPRGWSWVDPLNDVKTAIMGRRAGMSTLADAGAQQGKDWRDTIDQIAAENEYAKQKGVTLDLSALDPSRDNTGAPTDAIPGKTTPGKPNSPDDEENDQ